MSVKRYTAYDALMQVESNGKFVLASDYDRDTQALKERLSDRALDQMRQLEELIECQTERDELRVQVEAMRELLRKVAPHFAAPPGLGYLHADIDAALQAEQ